MSFDQITFDFIEQLVSDVVVESRTHEYRGVLPGDPKSKLRFVATATAFANTVGGVFMFGVGESHHRPTAAHGIEGLDYDESKRRLEQLLRTSTDPPLLRVSSRLLTRSNGAPVLLYGVAPGVGGPCAVLSQQAQIAGGRIYYKRGDGLNHFMTTAELRDAFLAFDQWSRDVEEFRRERLQFYTALEISPYRPSNLIGRGGFLALHVLPLGRLNERLNLLGTTPAVGNAFDASLAGVRTNVDGVGITFHGHPRAYVQCFRNGGVECIWPVASLAMGGQPGYRMSGVVLNRQLNTALSQAYAWCEVLEVDPPLALLVSALGVRDVSLARSSEPSIMDTGYVGAFDRDEILMPAVVIDAASSDRSAATAELIDLVWQSAGWPENPHKGAGR